MIKEQQPLFNKRYGATSSSALLLLADDRPQIVYAREVDFSHQQHLLWPVRQPASGAADAAEPSLTNSALRGLLGLEPPAAAAPAFARAGLRRQTLWKARERG